MSESAALFAARLSREFALLCHPNGELCWVDDRAIQLLGAETGRSLFDVLLQDSVNKAQAFLSHAAGHRADGWELTFMIHGEPAVFECTGMPYQQAIMVVGTELPAQYQSTLDQMSAMMSELSNLQRETHRQQRELQLLAIKLDEERLLFRGVASQLPVGVCVLDAATHNVLMANAALQSMIGGEIQPGDNLPVEMPVEYPNGQRYEANELPLARVLATRNPVTNEEVRFLTPDNEKRVIQISAAPILDQQDKLIAAVGVYHDITDLRRLQAQLEHDSLHDSLTALPNRRLLLDRLEQALRISKRRGTHVAILFLDLDNFKKLNDTFGHAAGDEALVRISDRLNSIIRGSDTAARLAGDEFVLLLDDIGSESGAIAAAERLKSVTSAPFRIGSNTVTISFSIGVALSGHDDITADALLENADQAMYVAKRQGKNRYHLYRPESSAPPDDPELKRGDK